MVELKLVVGGLHMQVSFLTSPLEQRTDTLRLVSKMLELEKIIDFNLLSFSKRRTYQGACLQFSLRRGLHFSGGRTNR